jgi:hypothetical protein
VGHATVVYTASAPRIQIARVSTMVNGVVPARP